MRRIVFIVVMISVLPWLTSAQGLTPQHQHTTLPPNARYEIVQSMLAARWTFRLDRFSGRVAQLVKMADDSITWVNMEIIGLPIIPSVAKPRFQIFTSGIAVRHTFLMNTENGKTWIVVAEKKRYPDGTEYEVNVWQPFAE